MNMNVFRILGDVSHTVSKCILIWAIHSNKSAEGVSLLTQILYILVFGARYLDLFWVPPWVMWWNFVLKLFYIASSAYIVFLMMRVFARTREREKAWKLATWTLAGSAITAPVVCLIFRSWSRTTFVEVLWTFSIELESVCVLPQLLLLRQTTVPTVLDSFYLVTLGSYRFFYILNWIVRAAKGSDVDPISIIFGILQTVLYIDFAWVYWTRQRVKLRFGGVVDSDDLSKSFIVRRFIGGRQSTSDDDDDGIADDDTAALGRQEDGIIHAPQPRSGRAWGPRGISVSADDTLLASDAMEVSAQMLDPSQFEDEEDDEGENGADAPPTLAKDDSYKPKSSVSSLTSDSDEPAVHTAESSTDEWRDNTGE